MCIKLLNTDMKGSNNVLTGYSFEFMCDAAQEYRIEQSYIPLSPWSLGFRIMRIQMLWI